MKKTATWLLIAITLIPFIVSPNLFGAFVDGKSIYLRGAAFGVMLLFTLILAFNRKESDSLYSRFTETLKDPIFIALTVNIVLLALSTLFAFDKTVAFFGESQRAQGFLTLFALYILYIGFKLFFDTKHWKLFFAITAATPIILCSIQFIHLAQGIPRPDALSGNPVFLAGYYLFTLFAAFETFREGVVFSKIGFKLLGGCGVFLSLLGIMLTGTRGAILGVAVACLVSAIGAIIWGGKSTLGKWKLRSLGISFTTALIILATVFAFSWRAPLWTKIPGFNRIVQTSGKDSSTNSRILYTQQVMDHFWTDGGPQRVLLGWGWDNYHFFWTKHYNPKVFYYDYAVADRSHNQLFDQLVMAGVLGLLSYLAIWFFFVKKVFSVLRNTFVRAAPFVFLATAYFVFLMTAFDTPTTLINFYALLAFVPSVALVHNSNVFKK